jgi:hypothetical protein
MVLKKKLLDPQSGGELFGSENASGDEFVPAKRPESIKNTASLNKIMTVLWCFLRTSEVLLTILINNVFFLQINLVMKEV